MRILSVVLVEKERFVVLRPGHARLYCLEAVQADITTEHGTVWLWSSLILQIKTKAPREMHVTTRTFDYTYIRLQNLAVVKT